MMVLATLLARITRNPLSGAGSSPVTILPHKHSLDSFLPSPKMLQIDLLNLHKNLSALYDSDLVTPNEAKSNSNWPQWLEALKVEYSSLKKHNVFGPLITNLTTKVVGFKLIFTKKRNSQRHVVQYTVRLVAQGFIQRPRIDYDFTYSLVMDSSICCYLLGMAVRYSLGTQFFWCCILIFTIH